jgi:polar amino acid transport system permease protein
MDGPPCFSWSVELAIHHSADRRFSHVLAFPLSVLPALARLSRWRWLNWPATALIYAARGVPLLMIVLWVCFPVPLLVGRNVSGFVTMRVTLVLYEGAYLAEVVRAGIEALPKGQMEAARAPGHSYLGAMRLVNLPQALFNMLPNLLSQFVSTIKETTFAANQINNSRWCTAASTHLTTRPRDVGAAEAAGEPN